MNVTVVVTADQARYIAATYEQTPQQYLDAHVLEVDRQLKEIQKRAIEQEEMAKAQAEIDRRIEEEL